MKRALLISLALVLALVGWTTLRAEDGFYVVSSMKGKYAPVPKTGQTASYGDRDDGNLQKGVASPSPRFTDNYNGTVTDNLTGLIWLKNANAFGSRTWDQALSDANGLASGSAGLSDGSKAGDWRLPNVKELQSLVDHSRSEPALPEGNPFTGMQSLYYWSSTSYATNTAYAWCVHFRVGDALIPGLDKSGSNYYVWCVRGGK